MSILWSVFAVILNPFFNIILGKETGTMFPISVQNKEVNALLDTGAEKICLSMDMFARLKLPLNVAKVPKLRNASEEI